MKVPSRAKSAVCPSVIFVPPFAGRLTPTLSQFNRQDVGAGPRQLNGILRIELRPRSVENLVAKPQNHKANRLVAVQLRFWPACGLMVSNRLEAHLGTIGPIDGLCDLSSA